MLVSSGPKYKTSATTFSLEAVVIFIEQTIEKELKDELEFLISYDKTKEAMRDIIDMPDRKIDQFINFCLQNNGRLSKKKYRDFFDFLTGEELSRLEYAVRENYYL